MGMSVSKAGRIVIGATAAVLAAVGVAALAGTGRLHKEDPKLPVNLNETLTNEMSDTSSLLGFDLKVRQYLNLWGLQGASLSIMRNDSLLFAKGYGWADTKKKMQPLQVTIAPSDKPAELVTHGGEEFNLVTEGSIIVTLGNKEILLEEGDSIYFDPRIPHGQRCGGDKPGTFITFICE
jgi:mannose-6-phosphate isomerase-like protein (cupin superfamily)